MGVFQGYLVVLVMSIRAAQFDWRQSHLWASDSKSQAASKNTNGVSRTI